MKKNFTLTGAASIFILASAISIFNTSCTPSTAGEAKTVTTATTGSTIPQLLPRQGELSTTEEWTRTQTAVNAAIKKIEKDPNDHNSYIKLAEIYVNEARVTGEHGYYYPAILSLLDNLLAKNPTGDIPFKAMSLKSSVYLSLHQFATARETAEQAAKLNPDNAQIYGALVDANVELGNYPEAVKMAETMMDKRPDLLSYSRASYLREIHGDPKGAIQAMTMAVESGYPGFENTAWTRNTLAHIYETYGDLVSAETQYKNTLAERPNYPFALAGLASIEKKKGNVKEAEKLLNDAAGIIPEVAFYAELAELYQSTGRTAEAEKTTTDVLAMMADDEAKGHMMSLEYAKVYMNLVHDYDKALAYAITEYAARPTNIDVNKALAEIYFRKGNIREAEKHLSIAFSTGSKNPELLMIAGLISFANGNAKQGFDFVKTSRETDPYQDTQFSKEAENAMASIKN